MDIVVYLPTGEQIWVDITIANPEAPTYLNQPRAATEIRENAKKSKYLKHATERGITFLPAAIDTYGATGEGMETLLQFLARSAYETHPWPYTADEDAWTGRFRYLLRKRVAHTLAIGNHLLLEEAALRSTALRRARSGARATAAKNSYEWLWKQTAFQREEFEMY